MIKSTVCLVHQTAKEYLLRCTGETDQHKMIGNAKTWKNSLDPAVSNLVLAKACLHYLVLSDFSHGPIPLWFDDDES